MIGASAERIESIVDKLAAALFAGAAAYAFFVLAGHVYREPQLGLFSALTGGVAYLVSAAALRRVAPEGRRFVVSPFEVAPIELARLDELLLTEPVELLLTEQVELILTDADRLRPVQTHGHDELVLDDILAELGPNSRVVRLFDPAAMPTPGQLNDRIARHIREGASPSSAPPDASQALYDALAELRRSLR